MTAFRLWICGIIGTFARASIARQGAVPGLDKQRATRTQTSRESGRLSSNHLFGAWLTDTVSYYH